jgi:predicted aminopeptidase
MIAGMLSRLIGVASLSTLAGCGTVEFYWQGLTGHLDLLNRAQPVTAVADATNDPLLKSRLASAQSIRRFASRELSLPDNGSYTRYADIGRPFVVWNVFAAPALSLKPRQWCFPVAGCVNYRGYFSESDARAEAARLSANGDDVHVGGVPAYSTLGYFDDPLLSSFIAYREPDLARLLFHELAHQVVYVKDDTSFNESFAVTVEEEGLRRWVTAQRGRSEAAKFAEYVEAGDRLRAQFRALIGATRDRLEAVYAGPGTGAEKLAAKAAVFEEMRSEYETIKAKWGGVPVFDRWFLAGANNAGIVSAGLYANRVPQFRAVLAAEGYDLPRFYAKVEALAGMPKTEREAALLAYAPESGAPLAGGVLVPGAGTLQK